MKQIIQNLSSGEVHLQDVPAPSARPGHLLIRTTRSLISTGTERMLVEFGRAGWIEKARQQPEKAKQVLDKIRTDGLQPTIETVRAKLDQPVPMGYCNVGRILEVGEGIEGFQVGDRVASNGPHAEIVLVPKHLAARIPDEVDDEEATFTVIGAVALHGIRLLQPTLGETMGVFGLGLVGLLAVQLLRAQGVRVLGFDLDAERVELARGYGALAEDLSQGGDPSRVALAATQEIGVDGVLVTAATKSDKVMHQAARMCRKRGRIVLIGTAGLRLQRADFYEKELSFQVSCSYGPGRYDPRYEEMGRDYPIGFVRWTEQRNFEAVLELMRDNRLDTTKFISKRIALESFKEAYDAITGKSVIGVLLSYSESDSSNGSRLLMSRIVRHHAPRVSVGAPVCGLIGSGNYAQQKILPALVKAKARLKWVASSRGFSAAVAARRFGIEQSTTEPERIFCDPEVSAVLIATRHDTHAPLVTRALGAGKSVLVEKPLCLRAEELGQIIDAYRRAAEVGPHRPILLVGYNRRFAPLTVALQARLAGRKSPLAMILTCNAGAVPTDSWVHDPNVGGGRVLGEACHFIDLLHYLTGEAEIRQVTALRLGSNSATNLNDTVSITLGFADGSLGQVNYFTNGAKSFPKERLEVFGGGHVLRIDNFRRLEGFGCRLRNRSWRQDKGHDQEVAAFLEAVGSGRDSPISFKSIVNTTQATFAALKAALHEETMVLRPDADIGEFSHGVSFRTPY
ncbi:MAG: Gfo/Idh/MocA family oxidoreductase [Planctomycetes bacterium]|nr:Gfo/Idh/MocA family oxidoreductase [Planctomycetota bacterium]